MPPKKAPEAAANKSEAGKPDDGSLLFAFECLKAIGSDGMLDMAALSKALGHTNVMSTRNAFMRHKKKWGFGDIKSKSGGGDGQAVAKGDDDMQSTPADVLKPSTEGTKVAKKCGRPSAKNAPASKKEAPKVEEDEEAQISDVKSTYSDTA